MLSNILFRFSADGNRGAAFSAEVLRKDIADMQNCHTDGAVVAVGGVRTMVVVIMAVVHTAGNEG